MKAERLRPTACDRLWHAWRHFDGREARRGIVNPGSAVRQTSSAS